MEFKEIPLLKSSSIGKRKALNEHPDSNDHFSRQKCFEICQYRYTFIHRYLLSIKYQWKFNQIRINGNENFLLQ